MSYERHLGVYSLGLRYPERAFLFLAFSSAKALKANASTSVPETRIFILQKSFLDVERAPVLTGLCGSILKYAMEISSDYCSDARAPYIVTYFPTTCTTIKDTKALTPKKWVYGLVLHLRIPKSLVPKYRVYGPLG